MGILKAVRSVGSAVGAGVRDAAAQSVQSCEGEAAQQAALRGDLPTGHVFFVHAPHEAQPVGETRGKVASAAYRASRYLTDAFIRGCANH
jgi:hypothetical protein